jgi:hypothetical protein
VKSTVQRDLEKEKLARMVERGQLTEAEAERLQKSLDELASQSANVYGLKKKGPARSL